MIDDISDSVRPLFMITPEPVGDEGGRPDENGEEQQEAEEVQPRRAQPSPDAPTESEMRDHKVDHLPYREWCDECVEGFGRERAHPAGSRSSERRIPVVHLDHLFLTSHGLLAKQDVDEDEVAGACKVIVVYCGSTKCLFAHAVPHKGVGED